MSEFDFDIQIPPAKSPLLLPTRHHNRNDSTDSLNLTTQSNQQYNNEYDDLEFIPAGNWQEREDLGEEEEGEEEDSDNDEDSLEDWSLEDGHIQGVPCANMKLDAKEFQLTQFAASVLELLRDDLRIPGWSSLPREVTSNLLHIHKVSGALTNAVFFISIPSTTIEVPYTSSISSFERASPATVTAELERVSTPTPERSPKSPYNQPEFRQMTIEAPTLLLRIYGPSSGSLISRKTELHILHTLSSDYSIGPRVLGTFANGRVEEYFHSRAINKEEMRDPRISRWIGRRMRELHRVELEKMVIPDGGVTVGLNGSGGGAGGPMRDRSESRERDGTGRPSSLYSTSSTSSIFSFGTSSWSNSSAGGSTASLVTLNSDYGSHLTRSPMLLPDQRGISESRSESKRRNRNPISKGRHGRVKDKLGVWENITRWTREAKLVLKELDTLATLPGFSDYLASLPLPTISTESVHVSPLTHPSLLFSLREAFNLPLFEQQVKLYRRFVREWEKNQGKSQRIFSHNDTQYGNLLLLTPPEDGDERALERSLQAPHQKIIVVDFEYASANPRGFDIANHFIEWQADYHHPSLSHSLIAHAPYPTSEERTRFLKAYIGSDGGLDDPSPSPSSTSLPISKNSSPSTTPNTTPPLEDLRVIRLEKEIELWSPSSHAMWTVWGIVQAKEDLLTRCEKWKKGCEKRLVDGVVNGMKGVGIDGNKEGGIEEEVKTLEKEEEEDQTVWDFDYLSYSMARLSLFREELEVLGVCA